MAATSLDLRAGVVANRDVPADGTDVSCTHCGLPVPAGLVEPGTERQFCCGGCRAAWTIIHDGGLDQYYALPERRDAPVRDSGRSYDEFDHETFHRLYVRRTGAGLAQVDLYLEGVHCAACVWLVERVPLVVPGVVRAELNVRRALARVEWDPAATRLSTVARTLEALGYPPHPFRGVRADAVRRREERAMLVRIGIAGAVAGNVMLAAFALYSGWFGGMEREYERFFRWVSLVLTVPSVLGPGRLFFRGAWAAVRTRALNMDVPIAIGLAAGSAQGVVNTLRDAGPVYFDAVATLVFLLLAGRYLQQRGQRVAADAAELLYALAPSTARLVAEGEDGAATGEVRDVPSEALLPGMLVEVRSGDSFPADGVVETGRSTVDASLLTGESRPAGVGPGSEVFAGTVNLAAPVRVRVREAGETSRVARILQQVEESATRRAPVVRTADRLAARFVAGVLALAVVTLLVWLRLEPARAVDNAIALLVVTCPCALALATPLAVTVAVGRAARAGIFIKGGDVVEQLARPGRLFLDKTGTITEARTALAEWRGPDWVRPLVLALEEGSTHPIAAGFRRAWPDLTAPTPESVAHVLGGGIEGTVGGRRVVAGSPRFVAERVASGTPLAAGLGALEPSLTPVHVAVDGAFVALAGFGDPVRPDAAAAVARLGARGWRVGILSGDHPEVVDAVGEALGIAPPDRLGAASPERKLAMVRQAAREGPVVMVGDGVNDAAAIAAASVGIGVHGGAEACLATADVYIMRPGLTSLVSLAEGAERTMAIIRRNIIFALVYNTVGVTLAVSGLLDPLVAAILMPASSLTVVLHSWRSSSFREARA